MLAQLLPFNLYFLPLTEIAIIFSYFVAYLRQPKTKRFIYYLIITVMISPRISLGRLANSRSVDLRYEDILLLIGIVVILFNCLKGKKIRFPKGLLIPYMAYISWSVVASMIAIKLGTTDVVRSFFYLAKEIEYVCFFLLIINWLPGERSDTKVMHRALMTGVGLSIGFMIFQAVMGIKGLTAGAYGPGLIGESSPNPSGTMLSFCTFYLFSLYYQTRDKKYLKWSLWSSLAVLITVSKLNICALLLTFILFTPKKWMVTGRISKQMTKLLIVFIVLFGVGIVSAIFILDLTHIQGRLLSLHSYRHSIYLRVLLIWGPAIELVKQSVQTMFLGFGKGFKPVTFLAGTVSFDNIYLRQIIEGGIIGISLFVIYYSGIVLRLRSWGRKGGVEVKSYSMALLLFIGFLMINGIFADSFMVVRGMEPFYILLAMTYLAVVTEKKERLKKELDEPAVHH